MKPGALAWTLFRRDLRAGEIRLLLLALVVAVASLTSVSFFVDRAGRSLALEARQLLGGDLLLVADHPWATAMIEEAGRRGLQVARTVSFPSMVSAAGKAQLVDIKAVEPGYPLRGQLRTAPALNAPDAPAGAPPRGGVWTDERLAQALALPAGAAIQVGDAHLGFGAVLTLEPDRGTGFFGLAPRLMMNFADLDATGLIQVGSRATWRLHLAGSEAAVRGFQAWAEPRLGRGERVQDLDNARPEVRSALERARRFLGLAAVLSVVLGAVAVGLSARRFMERHLDACAVMRCLGATQARLLRLYLGEFALIGVAGVGLGTVLGYVAHGLILRWFDDVFSAHLPAPSLVPIAHGLAVGLVLLGGFALPPLLRLRRVSTLRVLRREWGGGEVPTATSYVLGTAALAGLMLWVAGDLRLGLYVVAGFAAAAAAFAGFAWLMLHLVGRGLGWSAGPWRYGLASLRRRGTGTVIQAVSLGLGLTAMVLLGISRDDLLATWQASVPADAPNRFIINIQPDQLDPLGDFLAQSGVARPVLFPMVRGRLVAVNGRSVSADSYEDERAKRLVEREFNLSWAASLAEDNRVVAGRWLPHEGQSGLSVEEGLAATLGLKLGDRLRFEVAGNAVERPIGSLRKVDWNSMRVNFFVIAPPGVLEDMPASYITSLHLAPGQQAVVHGLVERFPNLTVIDVGAIVAQVREMVGRVAQAAQFIFLFALLSGVAVLLAAVDATQDERRFEMAVLRTLGARDGQLRGALLGEFGALGLVAGLAAGVAASAIAWVLGRFVFQLPYVPGAGALVGGVVAGVAGVVLAGWLGARRVLAAPAAESLRSGA